MGKLDGKLSESIDLYLKCELSDYEKIDNREEDSYRISAGIDFRPTDNDFFSFKGYTYTWDFTHGYPTNMYGHKYGDVGYDQVEIQYTRYLSDWNALTLGGEVQTQGIDYVIHNYDNAGNETGIVTVNEDVKTSSLYVQKELPYTPKHILSILPAYELEKYGLGASATVSYIGKQYTNSDNTDEIDAHTVVDAKIYKRLSNKAKLSFEADNIFDSDKGDEGNFRTGRTFTVKLDVSF